MLSDKAIIEGYFNWVKQMSDCRLKCFGKKPILRKCVENYSEGQLLTFYWIAIESEGPVEAAAQLAALSKDEVSHPLDTEPYSAHPPTH